MHDFITRLRITPGVEIIDQDQSWKICLRKTDGLLLEVTVPHEVLEWFVTARHTGEDREIWSDWIDYYSVDGEKEAELRSDMAHDVEQFVNRLRVEEIRIVESRTFLGRRQRLEWRMNGEWQRVSLCEAVD